MQTKALCHNVDYTSNVSVKEIMHNLSRVYEMYFDYLLAHDWSMAKRKSYQIKGIFSLLFFMGIIDFEYDQWTKSVSELGNEALKNKEVGYEYELTF